MNRALVPKLRELLDRLADSRSLSNDDQELAHDAVAAEARLLSEDGFLEALERAVGKSKSRRQESVYLLSEFTHLPEVVARITEEFNNPNSEWRHWLVQTVGQKRLTQLAPQLANIIESDSDTECRQAAIWSAGRLRAPACLPVLLRLAENPPKEFTWALTCALQEYGAETARSYLERRFCDPAVTSSERIVSAWGLAKLGEKRVMYYLVEMLFDPDKTIKTESSTTYTPGQYFRAAQAICDIKGWPFESNKSFIEAHRNEWRDILLS